MALNRNASCAHEKVGRYDNYHSGKHAAIILTPEIDLRRFPSHWCHAFMIETEAETGPRRSLQVFDAAGDAVHKTFLRDGSRHDAWDGLRGSLALPDRAPMLALAPRLPPEAPKARPDKAAMLREEWQRLTDTQQFLRLTSKLRMNRLGAYRIEGAPFVRALALGAVDTLLNKIAEDGTEATTFVGNRGCIQTHSGPVQTLNSMGPWQNVLDPGSNLHLRRDHIAELWAVEKPTQRGPAISVEAFDAEGGLILQIFGLRKEDRNHRPAFDALGSALPDLADAQVPA